MLSTLHTNDAPSAITRRIELGVPSYLRSTTVPGVTAQRLIRTLCPHCKQAGGIYGIMPMSAEIKRLVVNDAKLRDQAIREGMKPLRIAGAKKVAAGLTTIAEILKVIPPAFDAT